MLDNNLAPRIARSLNALFADQHHVVALRDCFPENASDVEWIEDLDQRGGWAELKRDLHIRTRPHERAALDRARIVFFFLARGLGNFVSREGSRQLICALPHKAALALHAGN